MAVPAGLIVLGKVKDTEKEKRSIRHIGRGADGFSPVAWSLSLSTGNLCVMALLPALRRRKDP